MPLEKKQEAPGNENVLKGFCCPRCKALEGFDIEAKAVFTDVQDDGTGDYQDVRWTPKAYCRCTSCGFGGTVGDFTGKKKRRRQR